MHETIRRILADNDGVITRRAALCARVHADAILGGTAAAWWHGIGERPPTRVPVLAPRGRHGGMAFHTDAETFQRDRRRQNELVNAGWAVLKFTWTDVTERPDHVIATIRRALQRSRGDVSR